MLARPTDWGQAHRDGKLVLPPGYALEHGADVLLLRRAGGSVAAAFNTGKVTPSEVEKDAWADHERTDKETS